jgi:hypothetical protein
MKNERGPVDVLARYARVGVVPGSDLMPCADVMALAICDSVGREARHAEGEELVPHGSVVAAAGSIPATERPRTNRAVTLRRNTAPP